MAATDSAMDLELWLIRHGETAWSLSGAHTSRTDIPLTDRGRERARKVEEYLHGKTFSMVLTSPLQRARDTCRIAGFGDVAQIDDDLVEWNYGAYEGRTSEEIQKEIPGWSVWSSPMIDGESINEVAERANRVIARAAANGGHVALFAHGHILRILAACWIQMPPVTGSRLALDTGAVSILGFEHETRVISMWNRTLD
ncbi:MAG: histidine phosphatase family protein [Acidobacteriaceae bacterium]